MASYVSKMRDGIQRQAQLLACSILLMSLSIVGFALVVAALAASLLVLFWVGIPLIIAVIWKVRIWAKAHRRIFTDRLGTPISSPYRPWPKGSMDRRALSLIRESATWRDVSWLGINSTLGVLLYLVLIGFFTAGSYLLLQPLLYLLVYSDGVKESINDFGFVSIDTVASSLLLVPVGLLFGVAWWHWNERLMRWYAGIGATVLGQTAAMRLSAKVSELRESRDDTVDSADAELRRIERDLHDGAQARLVALGISLGMAEELVHSDPDAAKALMSEAREESHNTLNEIRNLARGIHPPVLADRGFSGALQAMALANPLPVTIMYQVTGSMPRPVESAVYFATSEVFTNITKHARARNVQVVVRYESGQLIIEIEDDGVGGARDYSGSGLEGVRRRLASFDGTLTVDSPEGGPTIVIIEVPCQLQDDRNPGETRSAERGKKPKSA